jgi:O-succinylbenzoic acid--CoA ligase
MAQYEVWLKLKGKTYTTQQLTSGLPTGSFSKFEHDTLRFCHEWLNGKEDFQIETSGSTGQPKKIIITRDQMEASARLTAEALNLQSGYNALLALDPDYIAGKMMLVRSLVIGMNVIAIEPCADPLKGLEHEHVDFAALVPYQVSTILQSASSVSVLDAIKVLIVGGAALDQQSIALLQPLNCNVFLTYGMTETISHVALQKINGKQKQDYFVALSGISLSKDERNCLVIDAKSLGLQLIKTNDVVNLLSATSFHWVGRWDNTINTGGVKVFPERIEKEIEKVFYQFSLPNRFFVAGLPDQLLGNKVALIIEGDLDQEIFSKIIIALQSALTKYEMPREIRVILKFIETKTQKINRPHTLLLNFLILHPPLFSKQGKEGF